jgi:hypothetical protein
VHGGSLSTKHICQFIEPFRNRIPRLARARDWRNGIRHTLSSHECFVQDTDAFMLQPWRLLEDKLPVAAANCLAKYRLLLEIHPKLDTVRTA